MKRLVLLWLGLITVIGSLAQETKSDLKTRFDGIRNQTTPGGNTKTVVADAYQKLSDATQSLYYIETSGTNTYTASLLNLASYTDKWLVVQFGNANTGASTLNINSIGAIAIKKNVSEALESGDIAAGSVHILFYDGTNFQVNLGATELENGSGTTANGAAVDLGGTVTADATIQTDATHSLNIVTSSGLSGLVVSDAAVLLTNENTSLQGTPGIGGIEFFDNRIGAAAVGLAEGTDLTANYTARSYTAKSYVDAKIAQTITNGVTTSAPSQDAIYDAFKQGSALSVWGVTGSSTGDNASIQGTANQVLRVNGAGTALSFGSIDLSQSATVGSSILPIANGGTGASTFPGYLLASGGTATGANTFTGTSSNIFNYKFDNIGASGTQVFTLQNTQAATSGNQQDISLHLEGRGFGSGIGSSQTALWRIRNLPVQAASSPTTTLQFSSNINGGGYTTPFSISSNGSADFAPLTNDVNITHTGATGLTLTSTTIASAVNFYINHTNAGGQSTFVLENDRANFNSFALGLYGGSSNAVGNIFGVSRADKFFLYAAGANNLGFYTGTRVAQSYNIGTNDVVRLTVTSDGRFYGSALHNNAGAVTGTTNQYIASGTYTPTLTNVTNVGASTAYACQWMRVGNVVTVSGKVDIDATAAAATELGLSLPIASAFTVEEDNGGTAASAVATTTPVRILADATNDRAALMFTAVTLTNDSYSFTFTYLVK